jgi:hypothetical protein
VPGLNGPASCVAAQAASYGVARAIRPLLTALRPPRSRAKENCEKNQAVAEEMVCDNVDAVFESACRFIVMKSLPGRMDEICTARNEGAMTLDFYQRSVT